MAAVAVRKVATRQVDGGSCPCQQVKPKVQVVVASRLVAQELVTVTKKLCDRCTVDRDRNQTEASFWEANW